jgi:beta-N-acetylhexosaminidase
MKRYSITFAFFAFLALGMLTPVQGQKQLPPFYSQADAWVDSVWQSLSPRERIGQLFQIAAYSNRGASHQQEVQRLIQDYGIGGVVFFQGGPHRQATMCNELQAVARVPLLISMDCEWGLGMRLDSTISFPYQMTLGAIEDNKLIYQMGREIGRQFQRLGMHVNYAPVVDVNNNPENPVINYRSFGEDKFSVTEKGHAYMKGMQDQGIIATAKHFPGHGDTGVDSHYDLPVIKHSSKRLNELEMYPFRQLMESGLASVMVAHLSIPAFDDTPNQASTLSQPIVTEILQKELGFQGIIFTDALNMKGVTKYYEPGRVEVEALKAGNDALVFPEDVPRAVQEIEAAVKKGELSQLEIDRRCRKLLLAKYWLGLNQYRPIARKNLFAELNPPQARQLNRQLTEASLTLLNNQAKVLPFQNLANQRFVALSIGKNNEVSPFQQMLAKYTQVDFVNLSADASAAEVAAVRRKLANYDQVIVGLHQLQSRPRNRLGYKEDVRTLISLMADSDKAVFALFRNPYILDKIPGMQKAEAIVVAYQGTELSEELTAQLMFGARGAKGKLPVTVNPYFPRGAGELTDGGLRLQYSDPEEVQWHGGWLEERVDSIVNLGLREEAFPGGVVLIAKEGKVVFEKSYGHHTYERKRETRVDDLFDFASVTKITGPLPALMQLVDQGKFDLDAPMAAYWPDFAGTDKADLTWRSVLAHNARLKAWIPYWVKTVPWLNRKIFKKPLVFKRNTFSPDSSEVFPVKVGSALYQHKNYREKMYEAIKKSKLNKEPGYLYSGLSFYLYPDIISRLTGVPYDQYCKQHIYRQIGAYTLTWNPWQQYPLDRIVPTERDTFFRYELLHGYVHDEGAAMMGGISGNAGLFGTANDLAKLMHLYMFMGNYGGEQLISESTVKDFTSYQYAASGNRRGLGFDKPMLSNPERGFASPQASKSSFGHSGYTGTFTWADPEEQLVLVFFSNRVHPTRLNRKVYQLGIYQKLHNLCYEAIKMRDER